MCLGNFLFTSVSLCRVAADKNLLWVLSFTDWKLAMPLCRMIWLLCELLSLLTWFCPTNKKILHVEGPRVTDSFQKAAALKKTKWWYWSYECSLHALNNGEKLDRCRGELIMVKEYRKYGLSTVSREKKNHSGKKMKCPQREKITEYRKTVSLVHKDVKKPSSSKLKWDIFKLDAVLNLNMSWCSTTTKL